MRGQGQFEVERETPMVSGWQLGGVVLVLALGSGAVVFVGSSLVCAAFGWSVRVASGASGVAVLGVWLVAILKVWQWFTTWETAKTVPDVDIRATPRQLVTVEVSDVERGRVRYADFPGDSDQLAELARGLLAGRPFSEADWTGKGRPFSRPEFRELRGQLLERGLVVWRSERSPQQGVQLTRVGRAVFERLLVSCTSACVNTPHEFTLDAGDE